MRLGEFREVKEIKNVEKKKPSNYLINELNKYFDEIDADPVMSKLDMIKGTSPEQLHEQMIETLRMEENK